jgi:DNA polymerase III sliding clamp (beta) subunit (PCNA family)
MKKIIVNSASLLTAMQYVKKVLTNNPVVPILENFYLDVKNGRLTISGSDLQNTFKVTLPANHTQTKDTFQACVPAEIMKYLAKLETQPLTLTWDQETYSFEVLEHDAQSRAKYSGENPTDYPIAPQTDSALFEITSDLFKEFKDLLKYADTDELRPAMTGIGFVQRLGKFYMAATNGHVLKQVEVPELKTSFSMDENQLHEYENHMQTKIAKYKAMGFPVAFRYAKKLQELLDETEKQSINQHFILAAKPAKILSDLKFGTAKKPLTESVTVCGEMYGPPTVEGHEVVKYLRNISFLFSLDGYDMELITRVIDERFPQFWNVIPQSPQTKFTVDKKKFLSVLDKAYLFANKTTHQIRLGLNGVNKISAEDLDFSNEFCAEVGGSYTGEPIEIGFNAELLKDVVSSFGDEFTLEMTAPNKAAVIRSGNALALCMPVMLNQYN